jgi:pseudouridine-5'-phosphate glycosidase
VNEIRVHRDVDRALRDGRAVVALESAVFTSGLPRRPLDGLPPCPAPGWRQGEPLNLEVARLLERTVRARGAVPATVAMLNGQIRIGLEDDELACLAEDDKALKAGVGDLAHRMAIGANAGLTVSATLAACMLPEAGPIRVFATGGIGGVHRGWDECPDISADLRQIADTPVCVVCAGAKAVLDVQATLEHLETLGVTVVAYRTSHFPLFYCVGDRRLAAPTRLEDVQSVAALCRHNWITLGRRCGIVLANPVPLEYGLNIKEVDQAVNMAEALATAQGITGRDRTPFLLSELTRRTDGRSLMANIALLANNTSLAAETALSLAGSATAGRGPDTLRA